jgi:hypothetical protein
VSNGLFAVTLDFGASAFNGSARWLEIGVRTNGSADPYTVLRPRQPITATPYATFASTAATLPAGTAVVLNGAAITNLNGESLQPGTVSSNALDALTQAQLALAGTGGNQGVSNVSHTPVFLSGQGTDSVQITNSMSGSKQTTLVNFNTETNIAILNFGDAAGSRGQLIVNTEHSGSSAIPRSTELQFTSPGHFAFGPGFNGGGGHIQLGIYTGAEANPYWGYWQYAENSSTATGGFSGAWTYAVNCYSKAGTTTNTFHPGMFGQQDTVNGGYYLDAFGDIGVTGGGTVPDAWGPSSISPGLRLHFGGYRSTTIPGSVINEQKTLPPSANQVLSFKGYQYGNINVSADTITFSTADTAGSSTNAEKRVFLLRSGINSVHFVWPINWIWLSGTCMTNSLPAGGLMRLELESVGPGESNILALAQVGVDTTAPQLDEDAASFTSRAGITDNTQKSAVNALVIALKAGNVWTNVLHAVYPFVGGTASSHAVNLLANSFTISWTGGVTHDANGVTGDAATGFGDTGYNPGLMQTTNSASYYVYERTAYPNPTGTGHYGCFIGNGNENSGGGWTWLGTYGMPYPPADVGIMGPGGAFNATPAPMFYFGAGSHMLNRTSPTAIDMYSAYYSVWNTYSNAASPRLSTNSITILAANKREGASVTDFSGGNIAFASIGLGLRRAQAEALRTAVEAFQTTLAR